MLGGVIIYTKKIPEMTQFYCDHFGFAHKDREGDRIVALIHPSGGGQILLHQAAVSQKMGQVLVKLCFDVGDVASKREALIDAGFKVGPVMDGGGYQFANLKDPSGNSVNITGRFSAVI